MAVDKGKQFEYAIMLSALSRLPAPLTGSVKTIFDGISLKTNQSKNIEADVKEAAKNMIDILEPATNKKSFYESFKQLGGQGVEPKTDVLFIKNGKKYSLKSSRRV